MEKRSQRLFIRVTEEEAAAIRVNSVRYSSVSHYVRSAIKEYSNMDIQRKLQLMDALGRYYLKFRDELSWAGGNLNQVVKRANELAIAGHLTSGYMNEVLMPEISRLLDTINRLKKELKFVTDKASKL